MLFNDILEKKGQLLNKEFNNLFELMLKNQTHPSDVLLVHVNGFYNPDVHNWTIKPKLSPYMIGPDIEGLSAALHYKFIDNYRKGAIAKVKHPKYLEMIKYDPEKPEDRDKLIEFEGLSIQLEMLIYLKIWESDAFIKKLFQAVRLTNGEDYDWHFKIAESNRDETATGTRQEIIRLKIRDRTKKILPILYKSIKAAYLTQIRNSIAHSKYSFQGRNIHPNNYIKNDLASQLENLPFDHWIEMIHETLLIYNGYIGLENRINEHFGQLAEKNDNVMEIRINREDPSTTTEFHNLIYRSTFKDWKWQTND